MILLFYIFYRIQKEVSTVTLSPLFSLSFGQRLEMCGPHRRFAPLLSRTLRRIPQAVSAVATELSAGDVVKFEFQYRKR